jgi:hypothetical protein
MSVSLEVIAAESEQLAAVLAPCLAAGARR